ncbi:MAG TPA: tetratricopeptide repeat protein [Acidobacteriaceae bacterium]|nr:tetratricopeptide repeat protein [Acidobacteriaceae bacterium]
MKWLYMCSLLICIGAAAQQAPLPPGAHDPDQPESAPSAPSTLSAAKPAGIAPALAAVEDRIESHQYEAARLPLLGYLQQHPDDARALFDLGFVEDSTGQQDAAERDYGKAIAANPKQFESHAALGLLYAQTNRADRAIPELQTASQLEPTSHSAAAKAQVWHSLAQLQLATDPAAAKQSLLKALQLTPGSDTPADLVLTGQIAEANDDPENAGIAYRRALAEDPASAGATAGLAHLLLAQKKPQEAEPLLRAALAKHPEDAGLTAQLASALSAEGNEAEAATTLGKLHQLQPANTAVTSMLADLYLRNGAPDKAAPLLAEAVQVTPDNPGLLTDYGQSLIYTRQFAAAIPILGRAVAADPRNEEAWAGLAFAHSQLHQDAEVLKDLSARQKTTPDTPETLFLWAISYDNLHQMKLAAEYYERFLAAAKGKYPNEEWQAKHRLVTLGHGH